MKITRPYQHVSIMFSLLLSIGVPLALAAGNDKQVNLGAGNLDDHSSVNWAENASSENLEKKPMRASILVPKGTKIPIVMDSVACSATSREGDEFFASTSEVISGEGLVVLPIGTVIKGRVGFFHDPEHVKRTVMELKFESLSTPDNCYVPLAAYPVNRGGVAHARRGLKDIAFIVNTAAPPVLVGTQLCSWGGSKNIDRRSREITKGKKATTGVSVGLQVGSVAPIAVSGKEVDLRVGDELKIELAQDLQMAVK
jgi:hypothetical protein